MLEGKIRRQATHPARMTLGNVRDLEGALAQYVLIALLSRNCLRAAFPALPAAPIVLKWTDDFRTGLDLPAQLISHLHEFAGLALSFTAAE
jgi:hypothetical protein